VFSSDQAEALKAKDRKVILVRVETSPEDIHGSRKPGGDDLALGIGIDGGMQELVERARIDCG
jgi:hypothetical protein